MKKIVSLFLAISILFCFASCRKDNPDPETTTNIAETTDSVKENKSTKLSVYIGKENISSQDEETYEFLTDLNYQTVYLSEEDGKKYSRLSSALDSLNKERAKMSKETANELYETAVENYDTYYEDGESFVTYTSNHKYLLQRADNAVVSLRSDYDVFSGGMHPNYGTGGYTFDTATGEALLITDVMTDISELPRIISEKIKAKDSSEYDMSGSLEEALSEYTAEQFNWTIGYQGVTFYFSPYEIASYAAGLITATIYFDEYPELFNKKYTTSPDSYAYPLPEWSDVEFDMNLSDDKKDTICVGLSYFTEESSYKDIIVTVNGNEFTLSDIYVFSADFYLVNIIGKYFLYVLPHGYSDYTSLMVYDINGGELKEIGMLDGTDFSYAEVDTENNETVYANAVFNNPESFTLETKIDLLSTYSGIKVYSANKETGMPESSDELYNIQGSEFFNLKSSIDLSVKILPELNDEIISAGSDFELVRTNGKTFVDAKLGDGRECRINVEKIDYQLCVNGTPDYECFEVLYYAG